MKFRNISYYLKEAMRSIIRNRLMSVASIITVASCILILSFSYCIVTNLDYMLTGFGEDLELSVYLSDDLDDGGIEMLRDEILRIEHVTDVYFVSYEEAILRFSQQLGENDNMLTGLENEHILPRSFDIRVDNINHQDSVKSRLDLLTSRGVDEVVYNKDSVDSLIGLNNVLRIVSIIIIIFLSIVSVVIIMNTIKLTVNSRKNEINIMKYVGATDWFIRWPFIIEGILIGLFGAIIPVLICWFSYGKVVHMVNDSVPVVGFLTDFVPTQTIFSVLIPFSILLGIGIGAIGSTTSIRKHLFV